MECAEKQTFRLCPREIIFSASPVGGTGRLDSPSRLGCHDSDPARSLDQKFVAAINLDHSALGVFGGNRSFHIGAEQLRLFLQEPEAALLGARH
jgi:hypothetical protein